MIWFWQFDHYFVFEHNYDFDVSNRPPRWLSSSSDYNCMFSCLSSSIRGRSTRDLICGCASRGYQITTVRKDFFNSQKSSGTMASGGNELERQMLLMRYRAILAKL